MYLKFFVNSVGKFANFFTDKLKQKLQNDQMFNLILRCLLLLFSPIGKYIAKVTKYVTPCAVTY